MQIIPTEILTYGIQEQLRRELLIINQEAIGFRFQICAGLEQTPEQFFFLSPPGAVLPPLAYLCSISDSITLNAGPVTNQYQWSTGETTDSIIVNQPGSYLVQVSNVCGVGNYYCNVSYSSPPSVEIGPADTVLCGTQTFFS